MKSFFIHSSDNEHFGQIEDLFGIAESNITIFSPYITTAQLERLLKKISLPITIITSWKVKDLWAGYSDIELYTLSRELGFDVYINNHSHLKVYLSDWKECIFGSANLTGAGLGTNKNSNFELSRYMQHVDQATLVYLRKVLTSSVLLDQSVYDKYSDALVDITPPPDIKEIDLDSFHPSKQFLISSLPMSQNVEILYALYKNINEASSIEERECALHDIALYKIPNLLDYANFYSFLKEAFFTSVFIVALSEFITEEGQYFGAVKEWVQNSCSDDPVPSRRDLTGNVQVLYLWLVELSGGDYIVESPNYSERIRRRVTDGR